MEQYEIYEINMGPTKLELCMVSRPMASCPAPGFPRPRHRCPTTDSLIDSWRGQIRATAAR